MPESKRSAEIELCCTVEHIRKIMRSAMVKTIFAASSCRGSLVRLLPNASTNFNRALLNVRIKGTGSDASD